LSDLDRQIAALNPAQRAAVMHGAGPLLVLAGAGSGKTRVVTFRIARLVRDGVAPGHILALTFTNKAAAEMRSRCAELMPGVAHIGDLTVSTFHSFGARFLRRHAARLGRTPDFTLYDDDDQVALLKRVFEASGLGQRAGEAREVRDALDRAKNAGRLLEAADLPPEILSAGGADIGARYEEMLARANAFDFGDLIIRPAELLADDPALAASVRARWPWVLVDEFQDTNAAQLSWLQQLAPAEATPNLCVVGDDDQSIYGWRGADVGNILNFARIWPGATTVRLERNYRSTGHILGAANGVIAQNRGRLGKTLFTDDGAGDRIEVRSFATPRDEARWVAQRIQTLCRDDGHTPSDFAILLRTNALSLDLEEALRGARLPSVTLRGRSFYERAEVRDAVAWLRLVVNPDDDVAFRRALGAPPRGVGETSVDKLGVAARAAGVSLHTAAGRGLVVLRGAAVEGLRGFMAELAQARAAAGLGTPAERVASTLLEPLRERLRHEGDRNEDARARAENVERLLVALQSWRQENPAGGLGDWLESVKLVSDADDHDPNRGAIALLTIHAAKGLEFPVCFVVGLEDGVFPHRRGEDDPSAVEEERRLCYVALTRARRRLALTWCRERRTFAETRRNPPSRFLAEIPAADVEPHIDHTPTPVQTLRPRFGKQLPRPDDDLYRDATWDDADGDGDAGGLRAGVSVWHGELGRGKVVSVGRGHGATAVVEFPGVGRRSIVARFLSVYEDPGDHWDT
jgi:DNA helicase-2/ATP-dependent DNA helicase PcrA